MVSCKPIIYLLVTFFLGFYSSKSHAQVENTTQPYVTILQGPLVGKTLTTSHNRTISAYLGIPYAQPPVGNLRFSNPVPANGWNETRNATVDANICPQFRDNLTVGEEDCLYLNVYTPQLSGSTNSSLFPVMVWIHGGAFVEGSGISSEFGPDYILNQDVVLVSLNYRLGVLGFLSTGDEVASGNWALKDQVLALRWVQDNIRYFGGDPDQVTLFGNSAGSACVHLLSLSNATIGLFHRYITQSGSALSTWAHQPRAGYARRALELGTYVGCSNDTSDSLITCLRTINFSDIVATGPQFLIWQSQPTIVWGPTDEPEMEGAVLTDSPTNLFGNGSIRDLPWMSGVVRDEALLFTVELYEDKEIFEEFLEIFEFILPDMLVLIYQSDGGASWVTALKSYYLNNDLTAASSVLFANITRLLGDSHFVYPAYNALRQQLDLAVNPQYFYTFNYRGTYSYSYTYTDSGSTENYGVSHSDELLYLFPLPPAFQTLNETMSETDLEMVETMVQLWTSFAINGTPTASTPNGTITWEPYSINNNYLRIGNESDAGLEFQNSFYEDRMQFWDTLTATVEESASTSDNSDAVTLSPNLLFVLFCTCAKFFLSATTGVWKLTEY